MTTTAAQAGRDSGFVQRTSKLDDARLAQMITSTLLATPTPSLSDYTQATAACGLAISPQGLDQRLTTDAAACLKQVLEAAMQMVVAVHTVQGLAWVTATLFLIREGKRVLCGALIACPCASMDMYSTKMSGTHWRFPRQSLKHKPRFSLKGVSPSTKGVFPGSSPLYRQ